MSVFTFMTITVSVLFLAVKPEMSEAVDSPRERECNIELAVYDKHQLGNYSQEIRYSSRASLIVCLMEAQSRYSQSDNQSSKKAEISLFDKANEKSNLPAPVIPEDMLGNFSQIYTSSFSSVTVTGGPSNPYMCPQENPNCGGGLFPPQKKVTLPLCEGDLSKIILDPECSQRLRFQTYCYNPDDREFPFIGQNPVPYIGEGVLSAASPQGSPVTLKMDESKYHPSVQGAIFASDLSRIGGDSYDTIHYPCDGMLLFRPVR